MSANKALRSHRCGRHRTLLSQHRRQVVAAVELVRDVVEKVLVLLKVFHHVEERTKREVLRPGGAVFLQERSDLVVTRVATAVLPRSRFASRVAPQLLRERDTCKGCVEVARLRGNMAMSAPLPSRLVPVVGLCASDRTDSTPNVTQTRALKSVASSASLIVFDLSRSYLRRRRPPPRQRSIENANEETGT